MAKGRDKKSSKGRLDKYYHLAKEQGYRARSAFKLIQLNKKYNFLEKSRALIDLCAAPGGWLQVATKYMPQKSLVIGVDLVAIKPIPGVITFQDDITTERCRQNLRQEMKTWKADVVLHDGAPNVGRAWVQDAFTQSELVLVSLKLATEFLAKGGTFVTKVFRSKDYNKLLWVFQQLFRKVEATKPPSSRNVSAEIFVVCRDFIAPKKIDPRILDPKAVFSDEGAEETKKITDIFKPEKKGRQREGYEDGNYTLFKTLDVMEFVRSFDPITTLGSYNRFTFESDEARELLKRDITTEDVKANCEDLKVLGKSDFKVLLKWRSTLREEYKMDKKAEEKANAVVVEEEPLDDDELLEAELANLSKEEAAKRKREKRKANEKKMKLIQRMQLNMIIPTDIALDEQAAGEEVFNIKKISKEESLKRLQEGDMSMADALEDDEDQHDDIKVDKSLRGRIAEMDYAENGEILDSDEEYERDLEEQMEEDYQRYKTKKAERDAKFRAKQQREEQDEWHGFDDKRNKQDEERDTKFDSDSNSSDSDDSDASSSEDDSDDSSDESEQEEAPKKKKKQINIPKKTTNSLMNDLGEKTALSKKTTSGLTKSASMFFDQDIFQDVALDELVVEEQDSSDDEEEEVSRKANLKRKRNQDDSGDDNDDEESDFEIQTTEDIVPSDDEMWDGREDDNSKAMKEALEKGLTTAESITLARQLANKEKTLQDLIDDGFSKEAFRDKEGLPEWFLDDEKHHNKPNLPVTKEAMDQLREKLKALNARPIKKVAEAKARKKFKTMQRIQKAQKKATDIADNPDMTEKEKAKNIGKLLARATKSKPKKDMKVVVARGSNKGIKGRPKGVKGRYKMVDGVMKNEKRAEKRREKKAKKRGGGRR
ncbi:FtsJ-domain-containing protein [Backusella circina FSU 941]|nr:FtsJ-domain-containing protein [Backusella circina FSU 941]